MKCKSPKCHRVAAKAKHGYCELHAKLHGVTNPYIPAADAARVVRGLVDGGVPGDSITAATGVDRHAIAGLRRGTQNWVRRSVAQRLRAFAESPEADRWRYYPLWRAQRRLRSLMAAGWRQQRLAAALGVSQTTVSYIVTGKHGDLPHTLHMRVCALFDAHKMDAVTSPHWSTVRNGWVPPLWWDDIDDPEEQPGKTHCRVCHRPSTRALGMCSSCRARAYREEKKQQQKGKTA